jgi:hypothetical protein
VNPAGVLALYVETLGKRVAGSRDRQLGTIVKIVMLC